MGEPGKVQICTIVAIGDDDPLGRKVGDKITVTWPDFAEGCGYACPDRNWATGLCESHGPTEVDRIVADVTEGFRADVERILGNIRISNMYEED